MVPSEMKLVKTKIGDHITVSLPDTFYEMSVQDIAQRYRYRADTIAGDEFH